MSALERCDGELASGIGTLETIGLLILVSVLGAWLVRAQGLGVLRRVQSQLAQGRTPGKELVDGLLILVAGALLLTPGFMTDALGLVLLLPPTRAIVRTVLVQRFRNRVVVAGHGGAWYRSGTGGGTFIDIDGGSGDDRDREYESGSDDDNPPPAIGMGPGPT